MELDRASRQILQALQRDGTLSVQQLAEQLSLSPTPVWRRLRALQQAGVIRRQVALLDREQLGLMIVVLAHVTLTRHHQGAVEAFERMVQAAPEILECFSTTGEADYVLRVVVADMKAYDRFLQQHVFQLAGIASIRSHVTLREIKYETALPLD